MSHTVNSVTHHDPWSAYLRRNTAPARPEWTVTRLAEISGVSRSSINRWLTNGVGPEPSIQIDTVYRIADALGGSRWEALLAAGGLLPDELAEEITLIMRSDRPPDVKRQMINRLRRRRDAERARRRIDEDDAEPDACASRAADIDRAHE